MRMRTPSGLNACLDKSHGDRQVLSAVVVYTHMLSACMLIGATVHCHQWTAIKITSQGTY